MPYRCYAAPNRDRSHREHSPERERERGTQLPPERRAAKGQVGEQQGGKGAEQQGGQGREQQRARVEYLANKLLNVYEKQNLVLVEDEGPPAGANAGGGDEGLYL